MRLRSTGHVMRQDGTRATRRQYRGPACAAAVQRRPDAGAAQWAGVRWKLQTDMVALNGTQSATEQLAAC